MWIHCVTSLLIVGLISQRCITGQEVEYTKKLINNWRDQESKGVNFLVPKTHLLKFLDDEVKPKKINTKILIDRGSKD